MANVKTITATTTESTVEFNATYQFMWFRNFGENDCYICDHSGIVANADDVTLLKAGEVARLTLPQSPAQSKAYIKAVDGSNTVEVHAQNFSDCPFKVSGKGGDVPITIDPTPTQGSSNAVSSGGVYTALQGVSPIDYSTTEQDTGIKWIDGKPIYRKTIAIYENSQLVAGLTLTNKELSGNVIPQNIDKAISCKQISMRSTGYIDNGNFTDRSKALVHQSGGTLYIDTNDTPVYMYAILEYTKTTDTAE